MKRERESERWAFKHNHGCMFAHVHELSLSLSVRVDHRWISGAIEIGQISINFWARFFLIWIGNFEWFKWKFTISCHSEITRIFIESTPKLQFRVFWSFSCINSWFVLCCGFYFVSWIFSSNIGLFFLDVFTIFDLLLLRENRNCHWKESEIPHSLNRAKILIEKK